MAEITGNDIAREAYRLIGRPPQADLPYRDLMDNAKSVVMRHLTEMKMSGNGHTTVIGSWRTPTAVIENTSSYVNAEDFFIPVACEWQTIDGDENNVVPQRVEFCAIDSLNDLRRTPQEYAAVYNNYSKIAFGQELEVLENREYRLMYESLDGTEFGELGSSFSEFPAFFVWVCAFETAKMTIHQVRNVSEEWQRRKAELLQVIEPGLLVWQDIKERWRDQRFGNRRVYKAGYRAPGR